MQLVTSGGNHCCLVTVMYGHIKWCTELKIGSFLCYIKLNMYLCISLPLLSLYINMINRKQLYTNQTSSRWKKVYKDETFYSYSWFKCCTENILVWWPIFFLLLFYSSICQLLKCHKSWICNGICNFSNIFSIKKLIFVTIFNVKA